MKRILSPYIVGLLTTKPGGMGQRGPVANCQIRRRRNKHFNVIFKNTLKLLHAVWDDIPIPGKGAIGAIIRIIEAIEEMKAAKTALKSMSDVCVSLMRAIERSLKGKRVDDVPAALKNSLDCLAAELIHIYEDAQKYLSQSTFLSRESDSSEVQNMNNAVRTLLRIFSIENDVSVAIAMHCMSKDIKDYVLHSLITEMPRHKSASYDSSEMSTQSFCLEGTRQQLLGTIGRWMTGIDAKPIFVLDGIAGTGKTTVARTVAHRASALGLLGASFFFSRRAGIGTAASFFPTIAFQLSQCHRSFAERIACAIQARPDAPEKSLDVQFQRLIVEPLMTSPEAQDTKHPILLVIDALDECEPKEGKRIFHILAKSISKLRAFRVLITSRPDAHILDILFILNESQDHNLSRYVLHDIESAVVEEDIRRYLIHSFSREHVKELFPRLQPQWCLQPPDEQFERVAEMAGTLFIVAATSTSFVLDERRRNPPLQLHRLLEASESETDSNVVFKRLDAIYQSILELAFLHQPTEKDYEEFQLVVGSIILLQDSLPTLSLADLLDVDPNEIRSSLEKIQSIIPISTLDDTPRMHHRSFLEFITKRCQRKGLRINLHERHSHLACCCLSLLKTSLPFFPHTKEPADLEYACRYWSYHLSNTSPSNLFPKDEVVILLKNFIQCVMLRWLVLSCTMHETKEALTSLEIAHKFLQEPKFSGLYGSLIACLNQGQRFLLRYRKDTSLSPKCLYQWADEERVAVPRYKEAWPPLSVGPRKQAGLISLSASVDETRDGEEIQSVPYFLDSPIQFCACSISNNNLQCTTFSRNRIAFSPDGTQLVSAALPKSLSIMDTFSWSDISTASVNGTIVCIAFTPDGSRFASGSTDGHVNLWDSDTGALVRTFSDSDSRAISSLAFTADGTCLIFGSFTGINVWDIESGTKVQNYMWDTETQELVWRNSSIQFSPDGKKVLSSIGGHRDSIQVWDTESGRLDFRPHMGRHDDVITDLSWSGDGTMVASRSSDQIVSVWDAKTGEKVTDFIDHTLPVTGQIKDLAFSADCHKVLYAVEDQDGLLMVRGWDLQSKEYASSYLDTFSYAQEQAIAFMPDGHRYVVVDEDGIVDVLGIQWKGES